MLDKESLLQATLHFKHMQTLTDDEEEAEETLSLCDLPLYGEQTVNDSDSCESLENHDYFEFFSQEFNPSTISTTSAPDHIIFCGKLIPYRQPNISTQDSSRIVESTKSKINGKNTTTKQGRESTKKIHYQDKSGKLHNFKVSILTSSASGKARWYFYLFGISRFSTKVEWRDIKNKQNRHQYPSPKLRFNNGSNEKVRGGREGVWNLRGLIGALSCGGNNANIY